MSLSDQYKRTLNVAKYNTSLKEGILLSGVSVELVYQLKVKKRSHCSNATYYWKYSSVMKAINCQLLQINENESQK